MTALRAGHDLFTDLAYLASAGTLIAMCAIYCMEVVLRYFFNAPTRWSTEAVSYLMLITVFLAMPHCTRTLAHVSVTLIPDLWPNAGRRLNLVLNVVGFGLCAFVTWLSAMETYRQYAYLVETSGNVPVLKWKISLFIALGFGNSALWYLRLLFDRGPIEARIPLCRTGGGALQ